MPLFSCNAETVYRMPLFSCNAETVH
jgi:hypothetical protein